MFAWLHFLAPVMATFFLDLGYSMLEMALITATTFYLTWSIFELPLGAVTDRFGRKKSLIIAQILLLAAIIMFIFCNSLETFIIASIIQGIGAAFISGTDSALLYDSLLNLKKEKQFTKIQGKALFYSHILLAITSIIGAYVYAINPRLPFILAGVTGLVSFTFTLQFKEPKYRKKKGNVFKKIFKSLKYAFKHKTIVWIILYTLSTLSIIFIFHRSFIQPYLQEAGLQVIVFGLLFALFRVMSSVGAKLAHKTNDKKGVAATLVSILFILGLAFLISGIISSWWVLLPLCIIYFFLGMIKPKLDQYLQEQTRSHQRATISSIQSLFSAITQAILAAAIGAITEIITIHQAVFLIGIIMLVAGIVFTATKNNKKGRKKK